MSMYLLSFLLCFAGFAAATRTGDPDVPSEFEGTILFRSRNSDFLERSILDGKILSREEIRDVSGLRSLEVEAFTDAVRRLGGEVRGVSLLHDWMHVRLPESLGSKRVEEPLEACAFLDETLMRLGDKLARHGAVGDGVAYENVVYNVASVLNTAGLEHLVSLVDLVVKAAPQNQWNQALPASLELSRAESHKRSLLQSPPKTAGTIYLNRIPSVLSTLANSPFDSKWLSMNTLAEAAEFVQVWWSSRSLLLRCVDSDTGSVYYAGDDEATPECVQAYEYTLTPLDGAADTADLTDSEYTSKTFSFEGTDGLIIKRCDQVPRSICDALRELSVTDPGIIDADLVSDSTFIYTMTFNETAEVGQLYESPMNELTFTFASGETAKAEQVPLTHQITDGQNTIDLPGEAPNVFNRFEANGPTLRELSGVNPDLLGNKDVVMATTLEIAAGSAAVNASASDEYLGWFGYKDFTPLVIDESLGVKNNVSKLCPATDAPGGFPPKNGDCGEAELDVLSMQSIAPRTTTVFYPTERSPNFKTDFLQAWMKWWDAWDAQETIPDILSLSWSDDYDVMGPYYKELEERLKKTVASGLSVFVSSGDGGASGKGGGASCYPADNPLIANYANETWPTASPWVTVVGGIMMRPIDGTLKETVASLENGCGVTSGGGFVGTWFNQTVPTWQKQHTERYLAANNASTFPAFPTEKTPGFNPAGRGFPDISAYADMFPTMKAPLIGAEGLGSEAGTSLAAPVAAGLFSLANQKLIEDGYEKIGYANPMLYWMGESCTEAFNDITDGNIQWGSAASDKCLYGYPAAPGWDAATGLGTIKFDPFVACAKRYQDEVRGDPTGSPPVPTPSPSASGSPPVPTPSPSAAMPRYASGVALLAVTAGLVGV
jgi:hypothetical protein